MRKRLPLALVALVVACMACNAPAVNPDILRIDTAVVTLREAWERILSLTRGEFVLTVTEDTLEQAIIDGANRRGYPITEDNIDVTINADETVTLAFEYQEPNLGVTVQVTTINSVTIVDGTLSVTVIDATVILPGGIQATVPDAVLQDYKSTLTTTLSGEAFSDEIRQITFTSLTWAEGELTITGQIGR